MWAETFRFCKCCQTLELQRILLVLAANEKVLVPETRKNAKGVHSSTLTESKTITHLWDNNEIAMIQGH